MFMATASWSLTLQQTLSSLPSCGSVGLWRLPPVRRPQKWSAWEGKDSQYGSRTHSMQLQFEAGH